MVIFRRSSKFNKNQFVINGLPGVIATSQASERQKRQPRSSVSIDTRVLQALFRPPTSGHDVSDKVIDGPQVREQVL